MFPLRSIARTHIAIIPSTHQCKHHLLWQLSDHPERLLGLFPKGFSRKILMKKAAKQVMRESAQRYLDQLAAG